MGKQEEITKFDRAIKDTELRLRTFNLNIDVIQKEIDFLTNKIKQLEENIGYLKGIKIITIATEYRKIKEDLKKDKTRLSHLKIDITSNKKAHKELELILKNYKKTYEKLVDDNKNNVLQGKFGKK
jgi:chromosome segregation ATPase